MLLHALIVVTIVAIALGVPRSVHRVLVGSVPIGTRICNVAARQLLRAG